MRWINRITLWVVLGPVLFWGVWELVVISLRARYPEVHTISQEMRSTAARGLASLAYFWAGMACHWFVTWRNLPLGSGRLAAVGALLWWVGLAIYLLSDALTPEAHTVLRHPLVAAVLGASSVVLFAQSDVWSL